MGSIHSLSGSVLLMRRTWYLRVPSERQPVPGQETGNCRRAGLRLLDRPKTPPKGSRTPQHSSPCGKAKRLKKTRRP